MKDKKNNISLTEILRFIFRIRNRNIANTIIAEGQHIHNVNLQSKLLRQGVFIDPDELANLADAVDGDSEDTRKPN